MGSDSIENRLHRQVAGYISGNYSLGSDLSHLEGVRQVAATEATIFYSARILEALTAAAVQLTGLAPSASAYSNLETLVEFNFVPTSTLYWANGLRRLGNDVRHMLRRAEPQDADLAAIFAERWIEWFFCQFRLGPRIASITNDGSHLVLNRNPALPALIRAIDAEDFDPTAWLPPAWTEGDPPFLLAATLAAVIANILLDRDEMDGAFKVLEPARERFPDDLRLLQLTVLAWKRRGDLEQAECELGPLVARSKDDDETAGLVGGIYKQLFLEQKQDLEILAKSQRAYRSGWEGSKSSNVYLGINAAATTLWLGRPADARRIAGEVRLVLQKRVAALARINDAEMIAASYWDEVTLAEAELLVGELAAARSRYEAAFSRFAKSKGNIKVALQQAHRHLAQLGISLEGKDFFKLDQPPTARPFLLGVTGHRVIEDESAIRPRIVEAIEQFRKTQPAETPLAILSPLAAGADCLVAETVLGDFAGRLRAVFPMEIAEYVKDFSKPETERFQSLLNRADSIAFPKPLPTATRGKEAIAAPLEKREAAYERAGIFVVDQCDALIALWDGQPSRGRGGTAEIVEYARKVGKPIAWINAVSPFEILMEKD